MPIADGLRHRCDIYRATSADIPVGYGSSKTKKQTSYPETPPSEDTGIHCLFKRGQTFQYTQPGEFSNSTQEVLFLPDIILNESDRLFRQDTQKWYTVISVPSAIRSVHDQPGTGNHLKILAKILEPSGGN